MRAVSKARPGLALALLALAARADAVGIQVTSNADSGANTLRAAITAANGTVGSDTITFAIGSGPATITLATPLPSITQPLIIDGTTQPGFTGTPLIQLAGAAVTGAGLTISASSTTVKGLVINGFNGTGITIGASGATVQTCYIGTNAAGTAAVPNTSYGINVGASSATIGGTTAGQGNLISGNGSYGILVFGAAIMGGVIRGNLIGTNATASAAVANAQSGVRISNASSVTVGGTVAGSRNVISGNGGDGVTIDGTGGGNAVEGNFIGTDLLGAAAIPNVGSGVSVSAANTIVGASAGGNLISGNASYGILVTGSGNGATIQGNSIGLDYQGTAAIPNSSGGIRTIDVSSSTIGGLTAALRNLISGNASRAISIEGTASSCVVAGNYIGTNALGTLAVANGSGVNVAGTGHTIGGTLSGSGNVISGNTANGIVLHGSGHFVQGNLIGTDAAGTAALGNGSDAVRLITASGITIGGTSAGARNVIAANAGNGIAVDANASSITIQGNYIGTNAAGTAAFPNATGISAYGPTTIGGTVAGAGNLISSNTFNQIVLGTSGCLVQGNLIGTNAAGTAVLASGGIGIRQYGGAGNTIGGAVAGARNVIAGNGYGAITIENDSDNTVVQGNFIGTNVTGTAALPNGGGISIGTDGNTIGGAVAGAGNVISGNTSNAVAVTGGATGNVIQGNLIGTNAAGTAALGNGSIAIRIISSPNTQIGGTTAAARNVISGNYAGISIEYGSTGTLVRGNYLGPDVSGTVALGNQSGSAVAIGDSPGNTIGGDTPSAGNVISGNAYGIVISGAGSTGNKVQGNYIGVRGDGVTPMPNTIVAIEITKAFDNVVGGTNDGEGNLIAGNAFLATYIVYGTGNSVLGNTMFGNYRSGIDLEPQLVNPNDLGDPDLGTNRKQNFPLLTSATASGGSTTVLGTLNSRPNAQYRVEFFGNTVCHPSGFGEGRLYMGFANVSTDGAGNATIDSILPIASPGAFVTATATSAGGDTSEFSPCAAVGGPNPGQLQMASSTLVVGEADGNANLLVTRSGGMQGAVSVHYATANGSATAPADYTATSGTLNFAEGEVVKAVAVPLILDALADGQETFTFTLSSPGGGATLGAQTTTTVYVDDVTPDQPWAMLSGDVAITEGNAGTKNASFTLTVTPHTSTVTVDWQTENGTAVAGSDYVASSATETFLPGELQKTINVPITGDTTPEPDEDFFVRITSFPGGIVSGGQSEAVILDDDGFLSGLRGDANSDGVINVGDVFYLINYLFAGGPAPASACRGDANNGGGTDVSDVFFLINYLFAGGPAPAPPGC